MRLSAVYLVGAALFITTAQAQTDEQVEACLYGGAEAGPATVEACDVVINAGDGPHLAEALNSRGAALITDQRLDEAIADFDQAEELGLATSQLYGNRARAYCGQGNVQAAIDDWLAANAASSAEQRRVTQQFLTDRGLYEGPIDGENNEAFQAAFVTFAEGQCPS